MCGICGYIGIEDEELIVEMTDRLRHRGPDDHGYFKDGTVHLGHRRLSIIDLAGGQQPMSSADGSQVIIYNGEIYNYRDLRESLEQTGHVFRTASDTEVLLRLFEVEGPKCLQRLNGMFAFAVYDRNKRELFLARDRIGIKPLYYLDLPGRFLFASESKSLFCYRDWSPTLNPPAVHDYLAWRYVPGETGMFNEVKRLRPGHYLVYRNGTIKIHRYWEPPLYDGGYARSDDDYLEEFADLMEKSVRRRMISDVPFGAYLSGGVDSSVIVALMAQSSSCPIKTFSVGFDYRHDELNEAAATADYLGCDHHEVRCRAEEISLLPEIVYHGDEPLGDAITVPMYILSRAAKREVTVILTGEGGDEIFAGYLFHKYMALGDLYRRMVPNTVRNGLVTPLLALCPTRVMNMAFQYPAYLGNRGRLKALDFLDVLEPEKMRLAYRHLLSLFDPRDTENLYTQEFQASAERSTAVEGPLASNPETGRKSYLDRLLRLQFEHWLPDNMLLRQDKMGMAHAIEGRVPYLDHELVEFAFRLPPRLKLRRLTDKLILRRYATRLLPKAVTGRRKMPFYVPLERYVEDPSFQELSTELLNEGAVARRGLFRPEAISRLIAAVPRREFLLVKQLFSLMVLELWFRIFVDRSWKIGP